MTEDATARCDRRLRTLAAQAERNQWSIRTDIDWDTPCRPPRFVPRRTFVGAVGQLYHGERATLELCRHFLRTLPAGAARDCIRLQIEDEARHLEAYGLYLDRLGEKPEPDAALDRAFDRVLVWNGPPEALVAGVHVILEGEAMGVQQAFADRCPCPLFARLNARIAGDEARHVAFGRIYLRERLAALGPEERRAIYDWIKDLWHDCARSTVERYHAIGTHFGFGEVMIERRWQRRHAELGRLNLAPGECRPAK